MVGLAFSVAASCNFPVLAMSILWRGTTTWGALIGGLVGSWAAVTMVVLSDAVWVKTFGHPVALFPYANPALFSMAARFVTIWLVSTMDRTAGPTASVPPSRPVRALGEPASAPRAPTRTDPPALTETKKGPATRRGPSFMCAGEK